MKNIFISVLNWNDAASTIACVYAIKKSNVPDEYSLTLIVIDNGSAIDDREKLKTGLETFDVSLIFSPINVGFAAGHNVAIKSALEKEADFIWLVNNDATVAPNTLNELVGILTNYPECGIVSPLIYSADDEQRMDFVGAYQDWAKLDSNRAKDVACGASMLEHHSSDFFVYGTAPLIRMSALQNIGVLATTYFAYFEDEEFCARLASNGWTSRLAFTTRITHFKRRQEFNERPAYYFYLMTRNAVFFYIAHTPAQFRKLIKIRLFSRALIKAAQLRDAGFDEKSNACLLGIFDALRGRGGPPRLDSAPPLWLRFLSEIFPYRLRKWLD